APPPFPTRRSSDLKGIKTVLASNIIIFDVEEIDMAGSIVAVHIAEAIIIQRFIRFSIQYILSTFIKQLYGNVILVKIIDHISLPDLLHYGFFGKQRISHPFLDKDVLGNF